MRNIVITTFVTLLVLGTAIIGSGHVVSAYNNKYMRDFTNSGNNQEIQQGCGNSCTQTSSNTINPGSSGLTSPTPSPSSVATSLTLNIGQNQNDANYVLSGTLKTMNGTPIAGATITFEGFFAGAQIPISGVSAVTDETGNYKTEASPEAIGVDMSILAHYAGMGFAASDSSQENIG